VSVSQTFALRADPRDLLRFGEQTAVAAFQFNSLLQGVVRGYYAARHWVFTAAYDGDEVVAALVVSRLDGYGLLHAVDDAAAWELITHVTAKQRLTAVAGEADAVAAVTRHPAIASRIYRTEHELFMVLRAFEHQIEPDGNYRLAEPKDIPALRAYAAGYSAEHNVPFHCDWHYEVARGQVLVADTLPPDPPGRIASCLMRGGTTDQFALCSGVYTFPRFRGKGYAPRLVANFALEAALGGLDTCLYVGVNNRAALSAYRRVGFFPVGEYLIHFLRPTG
jgi:GNAT superfamily N-acetyltransferase